MSREDPPTLDTLSVEILMLSRCRTKSRSSFASRHPQNIPCLEEYGQGLLIALFVIHRAMASSFSRAFWRSRAQFQCLQQTSRRAALTTVSHSTHSESSPILSALNTRTSKASKSTKSTPAIPPFPTNPQPSIAQQAAATASSTTSTASPSPTNPISSGNPQEVSESVAQLLPHLRSQPPFYIQARIQGKSYLLTKGDTVRLPFLMHGVNPGDVLRLNRATLLGSRDYVLKAGAAPKKEEGATKQFLDERLFVCRATVMGVEPEPLRVMIKKKQRNRRKKHVKSKMKYTVLRVSELQVNSLEEIAA